MLRRKVEQDLTSCTPCEQAAKRKCLISHRLVHTSPQTIGPSVRCRLQSHRGVLSGAWVALLRASVSEKAISMPVPSLRIKGHFRALRGFGVGFFRGCCFFLFLFVQTKELSFHYSYYLILCSEITEAVRSEV